ncbi:general secretion pathway protein H [Bradyrhizobium sp. AZCC 1578]|uniref:GspH/FimT family pseudopilin n=1 Tax=Bradyrhizobium sp. AZCC 1578 TaxID=3117027 RepID=UPI002FF2A879
MSVSEGRSRCEGFTLVEMLVVVAIIALTTTFAVPLLSGGSEGLRLDMASSELAAALRVTRSAAITRNTQMALFIDVDRRTFGSNVISERPFAPNIEAKLTFASAMQSAASNGGFQFFPDGSSTGGDVTLSLRGKQTKLCVDWLTGTVRKGPSC